MIEYITGCIAISALAYIELSTKVNTDNIAEKLAAVCFVIGILNYFDHKNTTVLFTGMATFFSVIALKVYCNKQNRRSTDRRDNGNTVT